MQCVCICIKIEIYIYIYAHAYTVYMHVYMVYVYTGKCIVHTTYAHVGNCIGARPHTCDMVRIFVDTRIVRPCHGMYGDSNVGSAWSGV